MELETEKLQRDITSLMKNSREIKNSTDIPECSKNIQLRFISRLIIKARAKIDDLVDIQKRNKKIRL